MFALRSLALLALIKIPAHLGYPVLFLLVMAESSGVPIPGEAALITAGVLAHDGSLNIETVIAIAAVAAIVGDNIGYVIGRTVGRKLLEQPGIFAKQRHAVLVKGEPFFERHGPKAVFLGRWMLGLRVFASWLAGINHMPWRLFLFWNALGGMAWATSVGLLSYYLGSAVEKVLTAAGVGGVVIVVIAGAAYVLIRRRAEAKT